MVGTPTMPERPDKHVLADKAVLAFQALLIDWAVRTVGQSDYGVDADVDVFENSFATGLTFKAQIKGSRKQLKGKKPSVRIKTTTLNYWLSLDVPVLVFFFSADSGDCYARWAHSYDPVLRRGNRKKSSDPKTTTFSFGAEHLVAAGAQEKIKHEVAIVRMIKERANLGPMPLRITIGPTDPVSLAEYESRFRDVFARTEGILRLASDDDQLSGELRFESKKFRFAMPVELASVTVHHDTRQSLDELDFESFSSDVMVAAASVLAAMGLSRQATSLARLFGQKSAISLSAQVAGPLAAAFVDQGKVDDALATIAPIAAVSPDPWERAAADALLVPIYHLHLGALSERGVDVLIMTFDRRIQLEVSESGTRAAARHAYRKAHVQLARKRLRDAVHSFTQTAFLDPLYSDRGYFHRELGGCFADLGRWHEAVEQYQMSRDSEDRARDIDFVLTDALLQQGSYAQALASAQGTRDKESYFLGKTKLIEMIAKWIVQSTGLEQQNRHQLTESALEGVDSSGLEGDQLMRVIASTDALDSNLWGKYLSSIRDEDDNAVELAFNAILTMAHVTLDDPMLWLMAVNLAMTAEQGLEVVHSCADSLVFFCREDIPAVLSAIEQGISTDEYSRLRRIVYERARLPPTHIR